ncbi:hypothetical protein L1987_30959 [Smallanthus sonchifolius]|uniref:Uncharacterized protein n=1 Tax=Smallanthus sonchifolius TaxID=185202 RepID=A0ACB9I5J7_9ASTR|nr:hypothetical protein L1987_30959 [Smallanthus sonchifolius]
MDFCFNNFFLVMPLDLKLVPLFLVFYGFLDTTSLDGAYDGDDCLNSVQPEVNLKNVLSGIIAIVTGRNKDTSEETTVPGSNVAFSGLGKNGDTYLHPSLHIPSASPLLEPNGIINYNAYKPVLEVEPPDWLRDSDAKVCMQCNAPFTALTHGRHHCRFCGGIFCRACSKGRCLLPVKFRERNPQRVCDTCYDTLDPLQGVLINTISNAVQVAKHDVMDWTCTRGWLNLPVGAKGLAILTVAKVGMLLTYKLGTGLVVARREDGSWSAPSAIISAGLGWGPQVGGELMDFIIVLHDFKAVKTFCCRMHFSLGVGCSAAVGPVGRVLEADIRAGDRGSGMCYTYSCTKGAFVGVSLEGNIVATRMDTNLQFFGDPYLTTGDILLGTVNRPKAAEPMYAALEDLYSTLVC